MGFRDFVLEKKINNVLSKECWVLLLDTADFSLIWETLLNKKLENLYNFVISLKVFENFFIYDGLSSKIEELVYKNKDVFEIFFLKIKTIEIILGSKFNQIIKTDLDILEGSGVWTSVSLDSFYFLELFHLNLHVFSKKKKNPKLYEIVLSINIIVTTLERLKGCFFYSRLSKDFEYPRELTESISFTKGYLICFNPSISYFLRNYKYSRKVLLRSADEVFHKKKITFIESISKKVFLEKIWLNDKNILKTKYKDLKVLNISLMHKRTNFQIIVSVVNFLNSIKLEYDELTLKNIDTILNDNDNVHKTLSNKTCLKNFVLTINKNNDTFTEIKSNLSVLVQSAGVFELIKEQINYYPRFFLNYRVDHRLRIYCYPWPVNYQLSHVVRSIIRFSKPLNINEVLVRFKNYPLLKKYMDYSSIFYFKRDNAVELWIQDFFEKKGFSGEGDELELKKECFYQTLTKFNMGVGGGFFKNISFIEEFSKDDITLTWEKWLISFKIKRKKLPYLVDYHRVIRDMFEDRWGGVFWADASSNAIQLIIFRLNIKNTLLLKLTNIENNDTGFSNIYDYLTEKIKRKDHSLFLQNFSKINSEELISLQDIDNNKYLLMPSAYGMGKFSYRNKLDSMLQEDERSLIWEKLNISEKNQISDYFWECASEELKALSFDIENYKGFCKEIWEKKGYKAFLWRNDLGITIAPISIKVSKRDDLLKKLSELGLRMKETLDEKRSEKLKKDLLVVKKKLIQNDKDFWKRAMVIGKRHKIFSRIYFKEKYDVDPHATRQSLIPNTIHAYDASHIHLCVQICKKLGIEILVIHDSIGCHPLVLPLVKAVFKIANILLLDINSRRAVYPMTNKKKLSSEESEQLLKLFLKIIESENFFK